MMPFPSCPVVNAVTNRQKAKQSQRETETQSPSSSLIGLLLLQCKTECAQAFIDLDAKLAAKETTINELQSRLKLCNEQRTLLHIDFQDKLSAQEVTIEELKQQLLLCNEKCAGLNDQLDSESHHSVLYCATLHCATLHFTVLHILYYTLCATYTFLCSLCYTALYCTVLAMLCHTIPDHLATLSSAIHSTLHKLVDSLKHRSYCPKQITHKPHITTTRFVAYRLAQVGSNCRPNNRLQSVI